MRRLYLIRHAKAGDRSRFTGENDLERPLSRPGRAQAARLAEIFGPGETSPGRILSSTATRCVQTVEPLAAALGVEIEEHDWLVEGRDGTEALRRIAELDTDVVAVCTHGDLIWSVLQWLGRGGVLDDPRPDAQKAGTWILDWPDSPAEGVPVRATYLPPPEIA